MTRHRACLWTMSGSGVMYANDIEPGKVDATLAFLLGLEAPPRDARIATVEVREVSEERDAETGGADVALAAGTVSSPIHEQPEES